MMNTDHAREHSRSHGIIQTASDAIITIDESQTILQANPAAAAMFGTTVDAMEGTLLDKFIPRDLRTLGDHPDSPGANAGIDLRMMGRRVTDYAITGLKANGEQFPLEGSSLSLVEDGKPIYTIILRDITERKQVHEQLERSFSQLRQLSAALQTIREEERTHIARELHDDLGQLLATLRLDLTLLQQQAGGSPESRRILSSMDGLIVTAITSLRRIASNLRPRALDEGGLYFALQRLRQDFIQRHTIQFELLADEADLALDDAYSTAIFRIVQEALTNIVRHAQARKVLILLHRIDSHMAISIQDDGRGIADGDMEKADSFGLLGMRERVWALRGEINISGSGALDMLGAKGCELPDNEHEGSGTRIDILLPLLPA